MVRCAAVLVALLTLAVASAVGRGEEPAREWQYVAESAEAGFDRPSFQRLPLSDERPEDLAEEVAYRGKKQLYAALRYGTPNSNRVTVVVDEREGGEFDLYVDKNRNRIIEPKDRAEEAGPVRAAPLPAEFFHDDAARHFPRRVLFRRSGLGGGLSFATTGFLSGTVTLAGREIAVRRVDGDGNGFFADPRDRVWLDLDGNGKWDPFSEQFPFVPVLKLEEKRYALRSDAIGSRLALEEINGLGTVRLKLATLAPGVEVADLELMLMGDDGSAYSLRGAEGAVQVPVGRYALSALSLSLSRTGDREPWYFVFSRLWPPEGRHWHEVARDAEVVIDPIGTPRFVLEFPNGAENVKPGKSLSIEPRLYTQDGLLINSCSLGQPGRTAAYGSGPHADVQFLSAAGKLLGSHQSGFA